MKKNYTPKFFHRIRRPDPKNIKIGFLGNNFNVSREARMIYAYLGVSDDKFYKTVFSLNDNDEITNHLKNQVDLWFELNGKNAIEIANAIFNEQIDILFALSDNKLIREILNYHPAPIQIAGANALTLKNAFDKNNAPYVNAIIGDNFINAAEKIETIKFNSAFCYLPFFGNTDIKIRKNNDEIIFGALYNENEKRLPHWKSFAEILENIPNAKLRLFSDVFANEKNDIIAKKRLAWAGISEEKIETFSIKNKDILQAMSTVNILLDSYPTGDNALILDALFMGTPVISMTDTGKSILNTIGLSEFAHNDEKSYVNFAFIISKDSELLSSLYANLRNIMESSLLMKGSEFLTNLKSVIFNAYDNLTKQNDNIPNEEEAKKLWDIFTKLSDNDNNKFAVMDYILLAKNKTTEMLSKIAIMLSNDELENIENAIQYLPENTLAKKMTELILYNRKKEWDIAEKLALEIKNMTPNNEEEQYIISAAIHILADIYKLTGKFKDSAQNYLESAKMTPNIALSNKYERYSNYLLMLHYTEATNEEIFEASQKYANLFKNIFKFNHNKKRKKKIRVGYISSDFRNHVVANFAAAFFQARNFEKFETFAYMTKKEDSNTNFFKKIADNYRYIANLNYDDMAKTIYNDKIDILVDLGGHTADNTLPVLVRKPAPIVLAGVGYFSTTGLPEVDYFIVDEHTAPDGEDKFFTEKLLRLKHSHFCLTHTKERQHVEEKIPFERNNFITFGTMNKPDKITKKVLETWKRILDKVPNSRLFLKFGLYDDPWRLAKEKKRMEEVGIDLTRVDFEGFSHIYLGRYNEMDIALDTFPYPGGGTTCDALLMNVPVVTLSGNSNHERFGKSILCNIGLDDLVAYSLDEYVEIAVKLANDIPRLKTLHKDIFERMKHSAIMDQSIYMKDLEEAYEKIYEDYMNGK